MACNALNCEYCIHREAISCSHLMFEEDMNYPINDIWDDSYTPMWFVPNGNGHRIRICSKPVKHNYHKYEGNFYACSLSKYNNCVLCSCGIRIIGYYLVHIAEFTRPTKYRNNGWGLKIWRMEEEVYKDFFKSVKNWSRCNNVKNIIKMKMDIWFKYITPLKFGGMQITHEPEFGIPEDLPDLGMDILSPKEMKEKFGFGFSKYEIINE